MHSHSPFQNLNDNLIVGNQISNNGPDADVPTSGPTGIVVFSDTVGGAPPITGTVISQNIISDEEIGKVKPFMADRHVTYPILLDPGRKVNELFQVDGIPKTFLYDRTGKLVAQSIDMRTRGQFLEMLGRAGLRAAR